jgi:hypothetical protein
LQIFTFRTFMNKKETDISSGDAKKLLTKSLTVNGNSKLEISESLFKEKNKKIEEKMRAFLIGML